MSIETSSPHVCACRAEQAPTAGRADVWDNRGRTLGPARLVGGARGDARGDGEHGCLLEACVLRPRGQLHVFAGQRHPHQAGPGSEDRRARLRLDRATAGARAAAGQLRAAGADSGASRSDAASQGADPGAEPGRQSPAQAAAGCGDQAGIGRHRYPRGVRPGHAGCPGRGHHRPGRARDASDRTTRFSSASCWRTSTTRTSRSPR